MGFLSLPRAPNHPCLAFSFSSCPRQPFLEDKMHATGLQQNPKPGLSKKAFFFKVGMTSRSCRLGGAWISGKLAGVVTGRGWAATESSGNRHKESGGAAGKGLPARKVGARAKKKKEMCLRGSPCPRRLSRRDQPPRGKEAGIVSEVYPYLFLLRENRK